MSLTSALQSTLSGLQVAQAQIQITSNNVANVNTEGYTRKLATPSTRAVNGEAAGVQLTEVTRNVSERLLRQLQDHIALLSGQKIQNDFLRGTQALFGSLGDNASLGHAVKELASGFEALGLTPTSLANKSATVEEGRALAAQLNSMSTELQRMRASADREIAAAVGTVNTLLSDIHKLNQQITSRVAANQTSPDLEDQRDQLLNKLAEQMDFQHFTRSTGEVVIMTGSGRTLLDSVPATLSHSAAAQLSASVTLGNGIAGIVLSSGSVDITSEITGGRIAGFIESRDKTLVNLQAEIDRLAEVLRDQVNKHHNNGTAFPPPQTLTSTRSFAGTDDPPMTGNFRVTVTDANGLAVETLDVNLAAQANIAAFVATVNGMTNASAAINADGTISFSASGTNGITVNELTGAVTTGGKATGMAQFLGLNDFFSGSPKYTDYVSDRFASNTAALGLSGTLSFNVAGTTTNVNYTTGNSLSDIASAISTAMGGSNIAATAVREGSGYRLQIADTDADNFFISDSGALSSTFNLRAGTAGTAESLAVRPALLQNPALVSHAESSDSATLAAGDLAVAAGDGSIARAIATAFTTATTFAAAGGIAQRTVTLESYAAEILSVNAGLAETMNGRVDSGESFRTTLSNQIAEISAVNLDEELANIIQLQNAYAASARLTSVIAEMLDTLIELG